MPPLQLNDEEMIVVLTLTGPIDQQLRPQFLQEVAQELKAERQAGGDRRGLGASRRARGSTALFYCARSVLRRSTICSQQAAASAPQTPGKRTNPGRAQGDIAG